MIPFRNKKERSIHYQFLSSESLILSPSPDTSIPLNFNSLARRIMRNHELTHPKNLSRRTQQNPRN